MKGCGVPSKGNVGARELTYSQCQLYHCSLCLFQSQKELPEHGKCDRRRTAGLMLQVPCCLSHRGITFLQELLNFVRLHYKGGQSSQRWGSCPTNTHRLVILHITIMQKIRGAGASLASDVHLFNPCLFPLSRCNTCSLISSRVMTYLTVQWCPICSSLSRTLFLQRFFST